MKSRYILGVLVALSIGYVHGEETKTLLDKIDKITGAITPKSSGYTFEQARTELRTIMDQCQKQSVATPVQPIAAEVLSKKQRLFDAFKRTQTSVVKFQSWVTALEQNFNECIKNIADKIETARKAAEARLKAEADKAQAEAARLAKERAENEEKLKKAQRTLAKAVTRRRIAKAEKKAAAEAEEARVKAEFEQAQAAKLAGLRAEISRLQNEMETITKKETSATDKLKVAQIIKNQISSLLASLKTRTDNDATELQTKAAEAEQKINAAFEQIKTQADAEIKAKKQQEADDRKANTERLAKEAEDERIAQDNEAERITLKRQQQAEAADAKILTTIDGYLTKAQELVKPLPELKAKIDQDPANVLEQISGISADIERLQQQINDANTNLFLGSSSEKLTAILAKFDALKERTAKTFDDIQTNAMEMIEANKTTLSLADAAEDSASVTQQEFSSVTTGIANLSKETILTYHQQITETIQKVIDSKKQVAALNASKKVKTDALAKIDAASTSLDDTLKKFETSVADLKRNEQKAEADRLEAAFQDMTIPQLIAQVYEKAKIIPDQHNTEGERVFTSKVVELDDYLRKQGNHPQHALLLGDDCNSFWALNKNKTNEFKYWDAEKWTPQPFAAVQTPLSPKTILQLLEQAWLKAKNGTQADKDTLSDELWKLDMFIRRKINPEHAVMESCPVVK